MTTALTTGITGMVGSRLTDYLLDNTDWGWKPEIPFETTMRDLVE